MLSKDNDKILILNTGGTFNKIYNQFTGELVVAKDNFALELILESSKITYCDIKGMIYKDSLFINKKDRIDLLTQIKDSHYKKIIIIHGTDTMNKTAKFLQKHIKNKSIVIVGSMVPFSIDKVEATANLMMAFGFLQNKIKNNVYISMHGRVKKHNMIYKNKKDGIFECL